MTERPSKRQRSESYGDGGHGGGQTTSVNDPTRTYVFQNSIDPDVECFTRLSPLHDSASHGEKGRHAALRAARWLHPSHWSIW